MRFGLNTAFALASLAGAAYGQDPAQFGNRLSPYVASPPRVVDRMLDMASIRPGETLYDLGCGDGRVLIAAVEKYKAKAVGVEIDPKVADRARTWITK